MTSHATIEKALLISQTKYNFKADLTIGKPNVNTGIVYPVLLKDSQSVVTVEVGEINNGLVRIYPSIAARADEMLVTLERKLVLNNSIDNNVTTNLIQLSCLPDDTFIIEIHTDVYDSSSTVNTLDDVYISLGVPNLAPPAYALVATF